MSGFGIFCIEEKRTAFQVVKKVCGIGWLIQLDGLDVCFIVLLGTMVQELEIDKYQQGAGRMPAASLCRIGRGLGCPV
jgi:hypothetical protein